MALFEQVGVAAAATVRHLGHAKSTTSEDLTEDRTARSHRRPALAHWPSARLSAEVGLRVDWYMIPVYVRCDCADHAGAKPMQALALSVASEERPLSSSPIPGAVRIARFLLRIESVGWLFLGTLLIVGGLIVLRGGSGLPGVVHNDDPGFAPGIGRLTISLGLVIAAIAGWGIWTGWWLRRLTKGAYISALLFCAVWIVLGLVWVTIATTAIPGMVTVTVNAVILVGLAAPSSSRAAFRGLTETGNAGTG